MPSNSYTDSEDTLPWTLPRTPPALPETIDDGAYLAMSQGVDGSGLAMPYHPAYPNHQQAPVFDQPLSNAKHSIYMNSEPRSCDFSQPRVSSVLENLPGLLPNPHVDADYSAPYRPRGYRHIDSTIQSGSFHSLTSRPMRTIRGEYHHKEVANTNNSKDHEHRCTKRKYRKQFARSNATLSGESNLVRKQCDQSSVPGIVGMTPQGVCKALQMFAAWVGKNPSQISGENQQCTLDFHLLQRFIDQQPAAVKKTDVDHQTSPTASKERLALAYRGPLDAKRLGGRASRKASKRSSKTEIYICSLQCGWRDTDKHNFIRHELTHYPPVIWPCPHSTCSSNPRVFLRKDLLRRHYNRHNGNQGEKISEERLEGCSLPIINSSFPRNCAFQHCGKTFASMKVRASHIADHYEHNEIGERRVTQPIETTEHENGLGQNLEDSDDGSSEASEAEPDSSVHSDGHDSEDSDDNGDPGNLDDLDDPNDADDPGGLDDSGPSGAGEEYDRNAQGPGGSFFSDSWDLGYSTFQDGYKLKLPRDFSDSSSLRIESGTPFPDHRVRSLRRLVLYLEMLLNITNENRGSLTGMLSQVGMLSKDSNFLVTDMNKALHTDSAISNGSRQVREVVRKYDRAVSNVSKHTAENAGPKPLILGNSLLDRPERARSRLITALHSGTEGKIVVVSSERHYKSFSKPIPTTLQTAQASEVDELGVADEDDVQSIPDLASSSSSELSEEGCTSPDLASSSSSELSEEGCASPTFNYGPNPRFHPTYTSQSPSRNSSSESLKRWWFDTDLHQCFLVNGHPKAARRSKEINFSKQIEVASKVLSTWKLDHGD